jgi:hypothetical protein
MVKSVAAAKQGVLGTAATANVPAREANPNAIGGAAREARPCLLRSQDAQRLGRRLAHVPTAAHEMRHVCATPNMSFAELPRSAKKDSCDSDDDLLFLDPKV